MQLPSSTPTVPTSSSTVPTPSSASSSSTTTQTHPPTASFPLLLLLPRDKHDHDSIANLSTLLSSSPPSLCAPRLALLVPGLVEWLADPNWPIFPTVADFLVTKVPVDLLVGPIAEVLETSRDEAWKACLLEHVVERMETGGGTGLWKREGSELRVVVERIATRPTAEEEEENGTAEVARGVLEKWRAEEENREGGEVAGGDGDSGPR